MDIDHITGIVIDTAYHIHNSLGPGLFESVYESILINELQKRSLHIENEKTIEFTYNGVNYSTGYRFDLLVEKLVIVELKSVDIILPIHKKQVLTYLRLMQLPVGLIINFGSNTFKEGVSRIVNNYQPSPDSPLRINQSSSM